MRKLTTEFVKSKVESKGYKFLDDEYVCPKGHRSSICWANWQQGQRCMKCAIINNSGENNYNWNPNLTEEDRKNNRNYPEYLDWRYQVFERDNFTCQKCDQVGSNLNAHHIESFNNNKELRTEISNGITLCKEHHDDFHHIYGRGNNTKHQLEEFLEA